MKKYLFFIASIFSVPTFAQAQTVRCIKPIEVIISFHPETHKNTSEVKWVDEKGKYWKTPILNDLDNFFFEETEKYKGNVLVHLKDGVIISALRDCKN